MSALSPIIMKQCSHFIFAFLSNILLCCCHYPGLLTYLGLLAKIQHGSMKVYELTNVT